MGRTKRGKLLIPSLIALACAAACGGSSLGGEGGDIGDPGSGDASTGATYGRGGGPTVSYGGASSIPQGGPAYAGASPGGVIYGCPPSLPPLGSRCVLPTDGPGYCKYPYPTNCGQPMIAFCSSAGAWEIIAPDMECTGSAGAPDPGGSLSCPSQQPDRGAPCPLPPSVQSYQCMYGSGRNSVYFLCDERRFWLPSQNFSDYAGAGGAL